MGDHIHGLPVGWLEVLSSKGRTKGPIKVYGWTHAGTCGEIEFIKGKKRPPVSRRVLPKKQKFWPLDLAPLPKRSQPPVPVTLSGLSFKSSALT